MLQLISNTNNPNLNINSHTLNQILNGKNKQQKTQLKNKLAQPKDKDPKLENLLPHHNKIKLPTFDETTDKLKNPATITADEMKKSKFKYI